MKIKPQRTQRDTGTRGRGDAGTQGIKSKIQNPKSKIPFILSSVFLCVLCGLIFGCGRPQPKLPPLPPAPASPAPAPAPAPEVKEPPKASFDAAALFFPHSPGDTWEMTAGMDGTPVAFTLTAQAEPGEPGKTTFAIETKRDGVTAQREVYRADETGVYRIAAGPEGKDRIVPPMPVLKLPWEIGSKWEWKGVLQQAAGGIPAEATFKLSGPEALKTPARDFPEVYRLDQKITLTLPEGRQVYTNTQWLAPKVGLVKQVTDDGAQKIVGELTSYSVGPQSSDRQGEPDVPTR
jgi:hypothetical protein